jgi:hypothetical protein
MHTPKRLAGWAGGACSPALSTRQTMRACRHTGWVNRSIACRRMGGPPLIPHCRRARLTSSAPRGAQDSPRPEVGPLGSNGTAPSRGVQLGR